MLNKPFFYFLFFTICIALPLNTFAIVANHNCIDITQLSAPQINHAKTMLHIAYGHTSHGSQITTGMTGLVSFANVGGKGMTHPDNIFAWNNGGTGGALDLHDYAMGGDVGYYPAWYNNTRNYLGTVNAATGRGTDQSDVNVIMWSWCGQVDDKYSAGTLDSDYMIPMAALEAEYWNVMFIYMTGHVDHWDDADNKAANQVIRNHCNSNNRILFDFADIESYDPDGTYYEFPHDNCDYYDSVGGAKLGNWATEWQDTHTEDLDWYICSSSHSEPLNANMKAYAAWWMFTQIASGIPTTPQNLKASRINDHTINLTWNPSTDNIKVTGYRIYKNNILIDNVKTSQYTDTAYINGTHCTYSVSTYDSAGNESEKTEINYPNACQSAVHLLLLK
ncbi:MAG: fibronectin type III domain-containing protein [Desulfobacteraceae bacterium]|nr:fibronectin type III domain-containing protein [Desulfobacteraceae bacterium]